MALKTRYYADMHAAIVAVEHSKNPDGSWHMFSEDIPLAQDQSIKGSGKQRGEPLETYLEYCKTYSAPYLKKRSKNIAQLTDQLQATGIQAVSMKRKQVWTSRGNTLNPHKVLRGQLSTAWRRTVREQRSSTMGRIAIILPIAVSYGVETSIIHAMTAATLALADIAQKAGRSVDLYGVSYGAQTFASGTDSHIAIIPLMLGHQVWSIHNVAMTTSEACFRRLCFRLWEIEQPRLGPISYAYGFPGSTAQIREWVQKEFAARIGLPSEAIHIGCTQEDRVRDLDSARIWVEQRIHQMDKVR
jgi:hypothetical protein